MKDFINGITMLIVGVLVLYFTYQMGLRGWAIVLSIVSIIFTAFVQSYIEILISK